MGLSKACSEVKWIRMLMKKNSLLSKLIPNNMSLEKGFMGAKTLSFCIYCRKIPPGFFRFHWYSTFCQRLPFSWGHKFSQNNEYKHFINSHTQFSENQNHYSSSQKKEIWDELETIEYREPHHKGFSIWVEVNFRI
uniref:Uncharacterized protein n=1 Tax=Megaselia scalaris TaxID=36166 RepID=T1GUH9_MEGSC